MQGWCIPDLHSLSILLASSLLPSSQSCLQCGLRSLSSELSIWLCLLTELTVQNTGITQHTDKKRSLSFSQALVLCFSSLLPSLPPILFSLSLPISFPPSLLSLSFLFPHIILISRVVLQKYLCSQKWRCKLAVTAFREWRQEMDQELEASFSYSYFRPTNLVTGDPFSKTKQNETKPATKHSLIKKTSRKILKPNEEKTHH